LTTTDARGAVITTTFYPDGGSVESVILQTTQLPNGEQIVETLTAYIAPSNVAVATQGVQQSSAGGGAAPGLQRAAAVKVGDGVMGVAAAVAVGVIGLALLL